MFAQKFADLHVHTSFSDGSLTPEELVKKAGELNISCISITDHDIVDGICPAVIAAARYGIEIIPGIEFSTQLHKTEVHLLAYFIDYQNLSFLTKLKELREKRVYRFYNIIKLLREHNVHLETDKILQYGLGSLGRLHIAKALVKEGYVYGIKEAFERYLGHGKCCYVPHERFSVAAAIAMIKELGGLAVFAHPYVLHNDHLLVEMLNLGIDGIEAYYPEHRPQQTKQYVNFAKKHGLLITGGSDYHGDGKEDSFFGKVKIDYCFVEKLRQAKENAA
ncbi:MAG: PHP domain-containing protein [Candidatus Omnitrophota bacterium]